MIALSLGLVAAVCWAVHDLLVRIVGQRVGTFAALATVLTVGTILVVPVTFVLGTPLDAPAGAYKTALAAGLFYAIAGIGLYKALAIGPVRLVAPIIGGYPILSMAWAAASGSPVAPLHWLAVAVVVAGVAYVAITTDQSETGGRKGWAIFWSLVSGPGFAIAFALSQSATAQSDTWAMMGPVRGTAIAVTLAIALTLRERILPDRSALPVLAAMGALDAVALGAVSIAGNVPNPEFAAVAASTFGLLTIVLAALFLRESLKLHQWLAVACVFAAIASLGI